MLFCRNGLFVWVMEPLLGTWFLWWHHLDLYWCGNMSKEIKKWDVQILLLQSTQELLISVFFFLFKRKILNESYFFWAHWMGSNLWAILILTLSTTPPQPPRLVPRFKATSLCTQFCTSDFGQKKVVYNCTSDITGKWNETVSTFYETRPITNICASLPSFSHFVFPYDIPYDSYSLHCGWATWLILWQKPTIYFEQTKTRLLQEIWSFSSSSREALASQSLIIPYDLERCSMDDPWYVDPD